MNRRARHTISSILLAGGTIAFLFLMYSLAYLTELGTVWTHPRVLVEAGLFVVLTGLGLYFRLAKD